MNKVIISILTTMLLTVASNTVLARGGGNGGNAANAGNSGNPGGMSLEHMNDKGLTNTNGPNATDPQKGLGRAAQRQNEQGAIHNNSGSAGDNAATNQGNPDNDSE